MKKRILVMGDTHCGSMAGLTPPPYQIAFGSSRRRDRYAYMQRSCWDKFIELLDMCKPYDYALTLGDLVDGTGRRSGGTELITTDRVEQCEMAKLFHAEVESRRNVALIWAGVYGTGYHSGEDEDWEDIIFKEMDYKEYGSHKIVSVNGCQIDLKHKVAGSSIPHGVFTPLAKEKLHERLWAYRDGRGLSDIVIRAHVHYAVDCGTPDWRAIAIPALQAPATKFGARQCSGVVDWGITIIDVEDDGRFEIGMKTVVIEETKNTVVVL